MSDTKHTPGPWTERNATIYGGEYDQPIATLHRFDDGREKIDARLIAAAPELLAALREISDGFPVEVLDNYASRKMSEIARAVLAKVAAPAVEFRQGIGPVVEPLP